MKYLISLLVILITSSIQAYKPEPVTPKLKTLHYKITSNGDTAWAVVEKKIVIDTTYHLNKEYAQKSLN